MTTRFDAYRPAPRPRWALLPDEPVAPVTPPTPRPEAPHTHVSVRALSAAERTTLYEIRRRYGLPLAAP